MKIAAKTPSLTLSRPTSRTATPELKPPRQDLEVKGAAVARLADVFVTNAVNGRADGFGDFPGLGHGAAKSGTPGAAPSGSHSELQAAVNKHLSAAGFPRSGPMTDAPSPLDVGTDPAPATPDVLGVGFTSGPNLLGSTRQEALGGRSSAETKTEAKDVQDSRGNQHIKEESTHKDDDGTVTTDKQTHDSDGKGNLKETQEIIQRHPDGSETGHRSTRTETPDGKVNTTREEWKKPRPNSTPNPLSDDAPKLSDAELKAAVERKRAKVADPVDEHGPAPVDIERLARGVVVSKQAKVNPRPDAEPLTGTPGLPTPPQPADPVDENPVVRTPTPRPVGGKPGGPAGGPPGPRG